jgi:hypothetical protein
METCKIWGELLQHNTLRFVCWGRSLKIHTEIKKGVVYTFSNNTTPGA